MRHQLYPMRAAANHARLHRDNGIFGSYITSQMSYIQGAIDAQSIYDRNLDPIDAMAARNEARFLRFDYQASK